MKEYISLVEEILANGKPTFNERTKQETISVFGAMRKYDLRNGFPLLTTKRVLYQSILRELFWFLRGETNNRTLGSRIWDLWADDGGDLGPIYGHQWRKWGAPSVRFGSATPEGPAVVDQISDLIDMARRDPSSRRLIVSAWNASDLKYMALVPCHVMFQISISSGVLDMALYQRSADVAVGVPFNIASYAVLMHILSAALGTTPGVLTHFIGDAHIYTSHVPGLKEQITRVPRRLPELCMDDHSKNCAKAKKWLALEEHRFVFSGYDPHPQIKFAVYP